MVCINHFYTDTDEEIAVVRKAAEEAGARVAVSKHWEKGGEGARELAEAVVDACSEKPKFKFLYELSTPLSRADRADRHEGLRRRRGVLHARRRRRRLKTHRGGPRAVEAGHLHGEDAPVSLSHDPTIKGRPKGWTLPIRDILSYRGAGFIVPVAGDIKLMPGTASEPAFRNIDVDVETGKVKGLFERRSEPVYHRFPWTTRGMRPA